jgi:cytochrome c oxidase subunit 7c
MLARAPLRSTASAAQQIVARRAFTTTRARMSSPYHYPEGPLSNIPFNPRKKGFAIGYWSFMVVGFGLPFGICGELFLCWCFVVCGGDFLGLGEGRLWVMVMGGGGGRFGMWCGRK